MSFLVYIETRRLTEIDRAWAKLAVAILKDYIESGCQPDMDIDWFEDLCFLANVNPDDLQAKIEFIYGTEDDYGSV